MNREGDGEIRVRAASNGRPLTLEPIMPRGLLPIQPVRVESSIAAGFRSTWLSGENEEHEITLTSGAGWGSKWMMLTIKERATGRTIEEVVDAEQMLLAWVDAALAAGPSPVWDDGVQDYVQQETSSEDEGGSPGV